MQPGRVRMLVLLVAMVLHQSAAAPVRQARSAANCSESQRPAQNCRSIARDCPTLAQHLFRSSVKQKNFTLPVRVQHEDRSASWRRHSDAQNGRTNPNYTTCADKGEPLPNTTTLSNSSQFLCQWTYECDYDAGRIPAFLHHAKCNSGTILHDKYQCKPVSTSIKVIRLKGCTADSDTEDWSVEDYVISTACVPFQVQ